eukprot:4149695-Pyramimonas_sp.AAC.1
MALLGRVHQHHLEVQRCWSRREEVLVAFEGLFVASRSPPGFQRPVVMLAFDPPPREGGGRGFGPLDLLDIARHL